MFNHYCPVKCARPSLRSSIGEGCSLILFGADLNFVCPESRTAPARQPQGTRMYVGKTLFAQVMEFVPWTS